MMTTNTITIIKITDSDCARYLREQIGDLL